MTLLLFFPTRPLYEAPFAIYPPGFLTLILWRPPWGPLCVRRAHGVPGVWAGPAFGSGSTLLPVGVHLGGRSSTCLGRRGARAALGAPVCVLRCPTCVRRVRGSWGVALVAKGP